MNWKLYWNILVKIIDEWSEDRAPKLGAALAYYTIFSLAPLFVIAIAVAGFLFGAEAAQGRIVAEIQSLVGKEGAVLIQDAIKKSSDSESGVLATIISIVSMLVLSSAAFIELQDSLNMIWKVKPKPGRAIKDFIKNRLLSFAMVIGIGFLLLVSLVVSAGISALNDFIGEYFSIPGFVLQIINIILSLGVVFILFSAIYKVLPDVEITWKDVRIGAIVTTILFVLGKYLIGLYLGTSTVSSTFGAAGSFAIILIWVYYSAQILFLGAEFTYIYATRFGSGITPSKHAVEIEVVTVEKNN